MSIGVTKESTNYDQMSTIVNDIVHYADDESHTGIATLIAN